MDKPHASDDEVLLLIRMKREYAKNAMCQMIGAFHSDGSYTSPKVTVLLDYLTNMVSALELMLKLLSGDWRTHNVGAMYEAVFESAYTRSDLTRYLEEAMKDQKYLFEPASSISSHIPEMEDLFEALLRKLRVKYEKFHVIKEVDLPASFGQFLRDNVARFHRGRIVSGPVDTQALTKEWEEEVKRKQTAIDLYLKTQQEVRFYEGAGSIVM